MIVCVEITVEYSYNDTVNKYLERVNQ